MTSQVGQSPCLFKNIQKLYRLVVASSYEVKGLKTASTVDLQNNLYNSKKLMRLQYKDGKKLKKLPLQAKTDR